jgi:glycine cleavage system H protein
MDGFGYINIFETKGIEYIIIIAFLLLIIPFWKILNRPLKPADSPGPVQDLLSASVLNPPQGIYFSGHHTWTHMLRSGEARIGINSLLSNLTGEVSIKMLKNTGTEVTKGEAIYEIEREGKSLIILSPVSGRLTGLNPALGVDPSLLQEDPYGRGWICAIRPSDWLADVSGFHFAAEATAWLRNELDRMREFLTQAANRYNRDNQPVYMQDGGELAKNPLAGMSGETWNDFQTQFLQ